MYIFELIFTTNKFILNITIYKIRKKSAQKSEAKIEDELKTTNLILKEFRPSTAPKIDFKIIVLLYSELIWITFLINILKKTFQLYCFLLPKVKLKMLYF